MQSKYIYQEGKNGLDPVGETIGYDSVFRDKSGKVTLRARTVKSNGRYLEKQISGDKEARLGGMNETDS